MSKMCSLHLPPQKQVLLLGQRNRICDATKVTGDAWAQQYKCMGRKSASYHKVKKSVPELTGVHLPLFCTPPPTSLQPDVPMRIFLAKCGPWMKKLLRREKGVCLWEPVQPQSSTLEEGVGPGNQNSLKDAGATRCAPSHNSKSLASRMNSGFLCPGE